MWPSCGNKGSSAQGKLFLILVSSACVASGTEGSEGMQDTGVHEQKRSALW